MDIENTIEKDIQPQERRPLRYQETLGMFDDVIDKFYYECEIDVYRTAVNNPPTEYDITPGRRRFEGKQGQELSFTYTEEEIDLMTDDDKKRKLGMTRFLCMTRKNAR